MLCIPNTWSQQPSTRVHAYTYDSCMKDAETGDCEFKGALSYYPSQLPVNVTQASII